MPAFYLDFHQNSTCATVTGDEYHHIAHVFRHQTGDILHILNGHGLSAKGLITKIDKKTVFLDITDIYHHQQKAPQIACAFSLLKEKNDLWIVEKLTELGVAELFPFMATNSQKKTQTNTTEKMINTAISALKQCENAWLPTIYETQPLQRLLIDMISQKKYTPLVASERKPTLSLRQYIAQNPTTNVCLFVGPEGGFTPEEFAFFDSLAITQVRICENTLRAETAAIAGVGIAVSGHS